MSTTLSLIVATVGRVDPIVRLFASLDTQKLTRSCEVILVDQNHDDRLVEIINPPRDFVIVHLRSSRGLSRSRNVGIAAARGDWLAFPDDDCWYPPGTLDGVLREIRSGSCDGFCGRCVDHRGTPSVIAWDTTSGPINRCNVFSRCTSASIFVKKQTCEQIGGFDERMGLGADTPFGAGEDPDFVLRLLRAGATLNYRPDIMVGHARSTHVYDAADRLRAWRYQHGAGRVLRVHGYGLRGLLGRLVVPSLSMAYQCVRLRFDVARYAWASVAGMTRGWLLSRRGDYWHALPCPEDRFE